MITGYIIPLYWHPDTSYINAPMGTHYLAWRVGVNKSIRKGLWWIEPVILHPEPLVNLLPSVYSTVDVITDVSSLGFTKSIEVTRSSVEIEEEFLNQVESLKAVIAEGA